MRNFLIKGGCSEKPYQPFLIIRELKCCLESVRLAQQGCGRSYDQRKRTRELTAGADTLKNVFLSDKAALAFTIPRFHSGASSSTGSCLKLCNHYSVVPRTMLRQGLGFRVLLTPPGEVVVRKPVWSPVVAGYPISAISLGSKCQSRALVVGTKASGRRGRRNKAAEMVPEDDCFKRKTPKTKKRQSVELRAPARWPLDESTASEAAAVDPSGDNRGSIHVIVGPMFAGKSTALLHRIQEEASRGRRVALVKSDKDTRYGLSAIVTHNGLQMPCHAVPDLATFKTKVGQKLYEQLDVIGIDEAQFFADLYQFCQHAADFEGKTVIVAGLDGDFLRRKFGSTLDLVPVADSVVKLSSRCEICGGPAIFSFRKTLDSQTELVGGADVYMPVCRQHFVDGQIVVKTASSVIRTHQVAQVNND